MPEKQPKYFLSESGDFVIENYNYAKPFANFFPGIAGKYGIPMWTFLQDFLWISRRGMFVLIF